MVVRWLKFRVFRRFRRWWDLENMFVFLVGVGVVIVLVVDDDIKRVLVFLGVFVLGCLLCIIKSTRVWGYVCRVFI